MKFTQWLSLRESKNNHQTKPKKEYFDNGHKKHQKKEQNKLNKKQFE
jgi:hypothetical protein